MADSHSTCTTAHNDVDIIDLIDDLDRRSDWLRSLTLFMSSAEPDIHGPTTKDLGGLLFYLADSVDELQHAVVRKLRSPAA